MEPEVRASPAAKHRARRQRVALGGIAVLLTGALGWIVVSASGDDATLDQPPERSARDVESREPSAPEFPTPVEALAAVRTEKPAPDGAEASSRESAPPTASAKARSIILHVLDRATGKELRDCETRIGDGGGVKIGATLAVNLSDYAPHTRGDSPLCLVAPPETKVLSELLVDAPGYVHAKLKVDWNSGGERTIELDAAAGLTIVVKGAPASAKLAARLYDAARREAKAEHYLRRRRRDIDGDPKRHARWYATIADELAALRTRPLGPEPDPRLRRGLGINGPDHYLPLDADARTSISELAAGRWIVDIATIGSAQAPSHALGEITLRAGDSATLELEYREVAPRPPVHVEGRVVFDRGWFEPGMPEVPDRLYLSTLDPDASVPASFEGPNVALVATDRRDVRTFDAGELPVGPALANLRDWHWSTSFAVPDGGSDSLEIVVPPPARVVVRGHESGAPDVHASISVQWMVSEKDGATEDFWFISGAKQDGGSSVEFVAPQGELTLWTQSAKDSLWYDESTHHVTRAFEEIAIEVRELASVAVTLREGTAAVLPSADGFSSLWLESGSRAVPSQGWMFSSGSPAVTLRLDGEGPALLHLDPCEGYVMVAPLPVELKRGKTIAVDLPVRRERR